jgi:NAD+ kinase
VILHDSRNPVAVRHRASLLEHLHDDDTDGITVVIGGDGFLLHTVADLGFDRTYLGLNAGRVGFLLHDVQDWASTAAAIRDRTLRAHSFPLLEAHAEDTHGHELHALAVNDVYLERASGQTARLQLSVDGSLVVETLVADGIITSTALGSTAYNFSAGGPACHPTLRVLNVTPICPHLPRLPPFALPESSVIDIEVQSPEHRPVRAVADGRHVGPVRRVSIRVAAQSLRLAYLADHDFTVRMIEKILHP